MMGSYCYCKVQQVVASIAFEASRLFYEGIYMIEARDIFANMDGSVICGLHHFRFRLH
jgi:hypothetical protein